MIRASSLLTVLKSGKFLPVFEWIQKVLSKLEPIVEISEFKWLSKKEFKWLSKKIEKFHVQFRLIQEYWPISDRNLIKLLNSSSTENFDEVVIQWYSKNDYEEIKALLFNWKKLDCIQNRIPSLEACLNVLIGSNGKDSCLVLIPALTAQLTGILEDLIDKIPKNEKNEIAKELKIQEKNKKEILLEYLARKGCGRISLLAYMKIIEEKTFLHGSKIQKLATNERQEYNKFRNKILHGDKNFLDYGNSKNLIRSWLELDLLIKLKFYLDKSRQSIL